MAMKAGDEQAGDEQAETGDEQAERATSRRSGRRVGDARATSR
jgi:hypothetical protein